MPTNRETSRVRVTVLVRIRDGVLDPQGEAVKQALKDMGHSTIEDVRIGKIVEVILPSGPGLPELAKEWCERLLANPVVERYEIASIDPL
jgi:phosphoribosylformylglycinamidine synthase|uniref:Phosphoribosylformylglycinamidine synthase subunit PurS n=1 Tax=Leptospirillum ferrodiazotrophum TaxID=412449 RepID=C6I123_9BACT|nr:MAG: phosphoribosylformylglycinamidine synthase, purS [Leptospirillum ferrodiazotrophum]